MYSILEYHFKKVKNNDLKHSKQSKFLHPLRFSYKEFSENDKLKFGDNLM
jgi:hypothetical protein